MIETRWKCAKFVKYKLARLWEKYAGLLILFIAIGVIFLVTGIIVAIAGHFGQIPQIAPIEIEHIFDWMLTPIIILGAAICGILFVYFIPCRWSV